MSLEEEYLYILFSTFNGNEKRFEQWLLDGEPYNKDGTVREIQDV